MAARNFTAAALAAAAALSGLAAQEPRRLVEAESIPVELASALIAAGPLGGDPQILVGSMPEWAASRIIVPAGGRVVGSGFVGMTAVAVIAVSTAPDSTVATLKSELLQRGWKTPPTLPTYGGGFRPSPTPALTPSGLPSSVVLCGDQQLLIVSGARRRIGGSQITYRLYGAPGTNQCNPPRPPAGAYRSPFPTLYNPPNVVDGYSGNVCQSNNTGSNGTGTILRTSMTPEALLDHYGRQIVDSGWTSAAGQIVARTWTKQDSTGAPIEMTLTITPMGKDGGCQRLELQVRTFSKP
jgi:hypothetical protein